MNKDENIVLESKKVISSPFRYKTESIKKLVFIRNVLILLASALFTLYIVNKTGDYPWGSDTYGHLYKGNILYDAIKSGRLFLNYNENWYNGIQPFRYWAPIPYYILAVINLITNNIFIAFKVFIVFIFVLGGLGWLFWGYYVERQNLCLVLAILWFFVPDNLRVLFSEGNIPFVIVNALIPIVMLYYYKSLKEKRVVDYIVLALLMAILTMTHTMITAMLGISLFILGIIDSIINKNYLRNIISLTYAFLGVMLSSFWLYPALRGGIMGMDSGAVSKVMESLTYSLSVSLNPLLRFENIEIYYFGIAFAFTALFGFFLSTKRERAPFLTAIIILLGTTKVALPFLQKLPMNQLFWMRRFTAISIAMIITAIILWKNLRKSVLYVLIGILVIDSAASFYLLGISKKYPENISKTLDMAIKSSTQRIAVLDTSYYGSFPSYYISYNSINGIRNQVYGWAWQGATTAKNIVTVNTALENGYYALMFDRSLELGADVLVVKKEIVKDFKALEEAAIAVGYRECSEDDDAIVYKYPVSKGFGTRVDYKGVAIGSYSSNIVYIFPSINSGSSVYLDDYSYDELKKNRVIFLSGFKYKDKNAAEKLILSLSESGVRVVVDATGLEEKFLGVNPQSITIKNNYNNLNYKGKKINMKDFPDEYSQWKTCFLSGIKDNDSYAIIDNMVINYIGNIKNDNLTFMALNLPYYAFLTRDEAAIGILEDVFGLESFEIPNRKVCEVDIKIEENMIKIKGSDSDIIVPIAALDAFVKINGDYDIVSNLIYLKTTELEIKVIYPYLDKGIALSVLFIGGIVVLSVLINLKRKECLLGGKE